MLSFVHQLHAAPVVEGKVPLLQAIELPSAPDSRSVKALVFGEDGLLHGATFGKDAWLFTYDPGAAKFTASVNNTLNRIGNIPKEPIFTNGSLALLGDNKWVASYMMPVEGRKYGLGGVKAGQILKPSPDGSGGFGFIMSGSSDFMALVGDPKRPFFYGMSATGNVLRYELRDRDLVTPPQSLGFVASRQPVPEDGPWSNSLAEPDHLPQVLILDAQGTLYTVGENGSVFRGSLEDKFEPKTEFLMHKVAQAPTEPGREAWATLDAAVSDEIGLIYGGTFDGYLFSFDPRTNQVVNLGKPLRQGRIQGLALSKSRLIGVGGESGAPQAFTFDPKTRGFDLLGPLHTTANEIITAPIGAMIADKNGTIYLGTTGTEGKLYRWVFHGK